MTLAAQLALLPPCADLLPSACEALAALAVPMRLAAGETLIHQGRTADGGYALLAGNLEISRRLAGGGAVALAVLSAPALVGELGLVADVRRTADVRARSAVTLLRWDRALLDAACALGDDAATRFARRVVAHIGEWNARLMDRIAETAPAGASGPLGLAPRRAEPAFDHAAFLALLKPFREMDRGTRDALLAATHELELGPGETLYGAGAAADGIAFVLRGALELRPADDRLTTVQILGPGAIAGLPTALGGGRALHAVSCHAREQSVLRRLSQGDFDRLYTAGDRTGRALGAAIAGAVADGALALSNRYAQLVGLRRAQSLLARQT